MNRFALTMLGAMGFSAAVAVSAGPATRPRLPDGPAAGLPSDNPPIINDVILRYCVVCHNDQARTANLTLMPLVVGTPEENAEISEKVIRKLRAGMMPPPGMPRPGGDTLLAMVEEMEARLDRAAAEHPNPGRRVFQRLNRSEYAASVRGLLGIEVDVDAFLPPETMSNGFDNIADVQTPSATLMEGYLRAAGEISRQAIGDPDAGPGSTTYKVPRTAAQLAHVDGTPFGTRGGIAVVHNFPADGEYVFKVQLHSSPTGMLFGATAEHEQIDISVDGERVALLEVDRWMSESDPNGMNMETAPIDVRAGPHRVAAAFIRRADGPVDDLIAPIEHTLADTRIGVAYGVTTRPHLRDFVISGPNHVTGVSDFPSRRRVFSCRPTTEAEARPCARRIVSRLAARAYRRPLGPDDVDGLMQFYDAGAEGDNFEGGIRTALQAILASPHFVFRVEPVPAGAEAGGVYPIGDLDLASRLSFFLWSEPPDAELLDLARAGHLGNPDVLAAQARRMLADPRSEALATRFGAQWLRLQDLDKIHPDALKYPNYDRTLAQAMRRETELFFDHLIREDRNVLELLTADYTFVNERLARHYDIPGVSGPDFRRVTLPDAHRRGLLGQGSILTLTSHAGRTSPVLRGKWVMQVLLNSPPPPPPPGVPDLEATSGEQNGRLLTTRERMEQHRANPVCRSCHRMMDPIGLALDNFDVTGAWRVKENGMPIDANGELYDGTPLHAPADLRQALLKRPEALIRTFTGNLLAYALGRRVEYYDQPTVRAIARDAAAHDHRLSSFILGVVLSPAFRMTRLEPVVTASGGTR